MTNEDRDVYLQKSKARALAYLPNRANAIASMMSDLRQHPEFVGIADKMTALAIHYAVRGDEEETRRFIVGFR